MQGTTVPPAGVFRLSEGLGSMNRSQRDKNRRNAQQLAYAARQRMLMKHTCENCGEKGGHWISTRGTSLGNY